MKRVLSYQVYQKVQRYFWSVLFFIGTLFLAQSASAAPNFTFEAGIKISSGSPQAITGSFPSIRMFLLRDYNIISATSTDGVTWSVETGVRLSTNTTPLISVSSITGCSVLALDGGGFRMLWSAEVSPSVWRIFSATSSDGLGWANETGTRIEVNSGSTFIGFPHLIEETSGKWRIFFIRDSQSSNDPSDYQVFTAVSSDEGVNWDTPTVLISEQAAHVASSKLTDGKTRVVYTAPLTGDTTNTQILSSISGTGEVTDVTLEPGVRFSTPVADGGIAFPLLFRSTETYRWRVYYSFTQQGSTTPQVYSALTLNPDPQSITPNAVEKISSTEPFTISGEIFSTGALLVSLQKSGSPSISGSSVTRVSDQSLTAVFDVAGAATGRWNVVIINPDSNSGTLIGGLDIAAKGGTVTLTNNLFRPSSGSPVTITVATFEVDNISVDLYTISGNLVKKLFDGPTAIGNTDITWDGTNTSGNRVASGTYIVRVHGRTIEKLKKIVVIN